MQHSGTAKRAPRTRRISLGLTSACTAGMLLLPAIASGQTWARGTTPRLREIVAVDRTGEPNWPYGFEDLAGDGATFGPAEQSVDLRTAYAATDAQRFWVRAYVSATTAPATTVTLFVFIDADSNAATGGAAVATNVDPALANDPSAGGYEWLFGVDGTAQVRGVWQWAGAQWTAVTLTPNQAVAEAAVDLDPIRFGSNDHGYLQGAIDLARVGLTVACDANLFVRSVDSTARLSDLDVGARSACVAPATNGVPNVIAAQCTTNAGCPANGACINGRCVYTADCTTNADCAQNQVCTAGLCVAAPGGTCTTTADCGALVCQAGRCVACTASTQCPAGQSCAPDGTCITGSGTNGGGGSGGSPTDLAPGEKIQGGACACSLPGSRRGVPSFALCVAVVLAASCRRSVRSLVRSRRARRA